MPFFKPLFISISNSSRCILFSSAKNRSWSMPRSSNAPMVISPLMPEKQSKYRMRFSIVFIVFITCYFTFNYLLFNSICLIMVEAINPAPNPLSMFTTDTPLAQLLSIASKAANPPKLAP